ncbi:MAG: methionine--tRNA ligase, partial [Gemmatimonadales bacterium]
MPVRRRRRARLPRRQHLERPPTGRPSRPHPTKQRKDAGGDADGAGAGNRPAPPRGTGARVTKFYVTTAIDYANGDPHLGQALEKVGTDAIARYRRLRDDDVHFVMGMDEHSQSVVQAAEANGVSPQAWADRMADRLADLYHRLDCSYDDWIRTTEPRHKRAVEALL